MRELRKDLIIWARILLPDDSEEVEDVAQEVLLALCRAREAVLNPRAYARWAVRYRCSLIVAAESSELEALRVLDRWPEHTLAA